ncbi:MAG: tyrosine-type recombinase/integrase [Acidimicrobiales bacterium]
MPRRRRFTVGELLDQFLEHARLMGRSPVTLREYQRIVEKNLRPELGRIKLSRLTAHDLDLLYAKLTARGNKALTVRHVHALMSAALRQGERWELVDRDVSRRASPPALRRSEVTAPRPDEVRRVIEAADAVEPALANMLRLAALTGARRGELCALRWSDLDCNAGTLRIGRSLYDVIGAGFGEKDTKSHSVRFVALDERGLMMLQAHRTFVESLANAAGVTIAPDAFMFSRTAGNRDPIRPNVLSQFTKRAAAKAGVRTHIHAFRHFCATQAIAAGFDVVTVGARLGHTDASITLRVYSHAVEHRDRELAASLSRTLALPGT